MKLLNLTGLIALTMGLYCWQGAPAALIETENVQFADASMMRGWDCGWDAEPIADFQTNEIALLATSQSSFVELLAWHQNVDLFSASNAIALSRWYSLQSEITTYQNSTTNKTHRLAASRRTVKAMLTGLFVCGIAGWAVLCFRRPESFRFS